jgi:hypothetical protein
MKFLLILTHVEAAWDNAPASEPERVYQRYAEVEHELRAQNKLLDSHRLHPSKEAKTVRNLPNDKRVIVDGPFADTKEVMGGCYVLECGSIEEAVKWAKRMPNYGHGSIEVRPIWETP